MTLARLLVGGLGAYFPPAPPSVSPYNLNAITDGGGMVPLQAPLHISFGGKTYYSWVDNSGIQKVGIFDETTRTVLGRYDIGFVHVKDVHVTPALCRRASDGKIVVVSGYHNGSTVYAKLLDPADTASWGTAPTNLDAQLHGSGYTYEQLWEYSGNLWLSYRDEPSAGTDSRWCYSHTSSSTPTAGWASQTIFYRLAGTRSYVASAFDPATGRIHYIATNGGATVGGISGFTRLGHFYHDLGSDTWHKSDGTTLTLPITSFASITEIYAGTAKVIPRNVIIDASGHPVVAAEDTFSGSPHAVYIRFNGTSWVSNAVTSVGTGYDYNGDGGIQAWGQSADPYDPNTFYVLKDSGGHPEVFAYVTADGGATFDAGTQKTFGATTGQYALMPVIGASSVLRVTYEVGTHVNYTSFTYGMNGLGL